MLRRTSSETLNREERDLDRKKAGAKCLLFKPLSRQIHIVWANLRNGRSESLRDPDLIDACLSLAAVDRATIVAAVRRADAVAAGLVTLALTASSAAIGGGLGLRALRKGSCC